MQDFKTINTWQRAYAFTLKVYQATFSFPEEEKFGLTSQLRRATASIPINISEGAGRISDGEFAHFLSIALGSAFETETQLLISKNVGYISEEQYCDIRTKLASIEKQLNGLILTIRCSSN